MFDEFEAVQDARAILSRAKAEALARVLDEVHGYGRTYAALETWRWVANADDHLYRASRALCGLDRRADPILPDWKL